MFGVFLWIDTGLKLTELIN